MTVPYEALLLLGGNIGEVEATLGRAERMIEDRAGAILSRSRDHWTEPWGFADERLFLNRALIIGTQHDPQQLMAALLGIEAELGRTREPQERYTARSIDIDILLIGDRVIEVPGLSVPHPRMHERAFALEPAADIAPHWRHPVLGRTVFELVRDLRRPA